MRSEGCQCKIPVTQAGIEPATFRIVAQQLNHCATAVGEHWTVKKSYIWHMFGVVLVLSVYGGNNYKAEVEIIVER